MVAALYAKIYWTLLACFCVMGLCLAFAQPLFSAPDEGAHWQTAHYRLERLFGADGCVPSLGGGRCSKRRRCASIPEEEFSCVGDTGLYGDALTYPGVLLSKLLVPRQTESAVRQSQAILLARLLQGLLVVLALMRAGVLALRARALGPLLLVAFMSSPLVAQQAFAVSSDSVQLACGVSLFSLVVAFDELQWADVALFLFVGWGSTAKPTLLPCLMPSALVGFWFSQLERDRGATFRAICSRLWALLTPTRRPSPQAVVLWLSALLSVLTVVYSLHYDATTTAVDPPSLDRQTNAAALRARPLLALELVTRSRYNPLEARTWVGPLGWLDVRMACAVANAFVRLVLVMLALELGVLIYRFALERPTWAVLRPRILGTLPPLAVGLMAPAVNVVFVTVVMYVLWSNGGSPTPEGVQFRYFFPAVMVVIAVLSRALGLLCSETMPTATTTGGAERAQSCRFWAASLFAHGLVLSLSLPYVARVFVDLSHRYHGP